MNTKRLKSLILRECMLMKNSYLLNILVLVVFFILGWLFGLSIKIGNIGKLFAETGTDPQSAKDATYSMFTYLSYGTGMGFITHGKAIESDIRSNWRIFNITLPASEKECSLAKVIVKAFQALTAIILFIINGAILANLLDHEFNITEINRYMFIFSLCMVYDVFANAIFLAARTIKETYWNIAPAVVIFVVAIALIKTKVIKSATLVQSDNALDDMSKVISNTFSIAKLDTIAAFSIPIIIASLVGGYFLNVLAMKRRYN